MTTPQSDHRTNPGAESWLVAPAAHRFVSALRALEDHGDLDAMVALGSETTRWWSTGTDRSLSGADGARRFWSAYRRSFAEIASEFTSATETPARVVLEWVSHGRHHNGRPVRYAGATVLELGEPTEDQLLTAVRLYFDSADTAASATGEDHVEHEGMLDQETAASGRNSGLAPSDAD